MPDSIEPIQKISSTSGSESVAAPETEHGQANAEHFNDLIHSNQPFQTSFERIDAQGIPQDSVEKTENNPIMTEDSTSSQKSDSTDQDGKGKKNKEDQSDGIEGVSKTRSKQSVSSPTSSLGADMQKVGSNVSNIGNMSTDQIKKQTKQIIQQMEDVKSKLANAKDIKPSYQTLLKNRLGHIDDNLKIALSKAGVEYHPQSGPPSGINSVQKFVDSFASSQNELNKLFAKLEEMGKPGAASFSPASIMAIQMKVGYIQQQLELFSNLLNKALESVKTVMNVQV